MHKVPDPGVWWQEQIPACFAVPGTTFEGDAVSRSTSRELFDFFVKNGFAWKEVIVHFAQFLLSMGYEAEKVDAEITHIERKYRDRLA